MSSICQNGTYVLFINSTQQLYVITKQNNKFTFKIYFYFNGTYNGPETKITDYNTGINIIKTLSGTTQPSPAVEVNDRALRNQQLSLKEIQQAKGKNCNGLNCYDNSKYIYNFYNTLNYNYAFITNKIPNKGQLTVQQYLFNNGVWNLQRCFKIPKNIPLQTYLFGCPNNGNYLGQFYNGVEESNYYNRYNVSPQVNVIGRWKANNITSSGVLE